MWSSHCDAKHIFPARIRGEITQHFSIFGTGADGLFMSGTSMGISEMPSPTSVASHHFQPHVSTILCTRTSFYQAYCSRYAKKIRCKKHTGELNQANTASHKYERSHAGLTYYKRNQTGMPRKKNMQVLKCLHEVNSDLMQHTHTHKTGTSNTATSLPSCDSLICTDSTRHHRTLNSVNLPILCFDKEMSRCALNWDFKITCERIHEKMLSTKYVHPRFLFICDMCCVLEIIYALDGINIFLIKTHTSLGVHTHESHWGNRHIHIPRKTLKIIFSS